MSTTTPRDLLRAMFDAAVSAALPEKCVPLHLPLPPKGRTVVVGAGKASAAMARGLEEHWPGPLKRHRGWRLRFVYGHRGAFRARLCA